MHTAAPITAADLADMVRHNIGCRPNGYLGQGYGVDVKDQLQKPMASGVADDIIGKIRQDVPLASRLGPGGINLYAYDAALDRKVIVVEVAGQAVNIGGDA